MRSLFTPAERQEYTVEFLVDAIVRGDIQTRFNAYAIARQWGWLSVDEIRAKENMNPLPDGSGKIYLSPLNMAVISGDSNNKNAEPIVDDAIDQ